MTKRDQFIAHLTQKYPSLLETTLPTESPLQINELVSENMISEFEIKLPKSVLTKVFQVVDAFYHLRENDRYQNKLVPLQEKLGVKNCHHHSVMMSYDFHLDSELNPRLIEVNTNAAFHVLGLEMYQAFQKPQLWSQFDIPSFKDMILNEVSEAKIQTSPDNLKVAIFDETPQKQRLFIEFLVYQKLFQSFGWKCDILGIEELSRADHFDFIYNRHTDFYFQSDDTKKLKELSYTGKTCVSPHPYEYLLLADKERMTEWTSPRYFEDLSLDPKQIEVLLRTIPRSLELTQNSADNIWQNRKGFFLKPMRAFGAKQSYRGGSVSRKIFDQLIGQNMIAQEFIPAPELNFETPAGPQAFKYDLRCYVYKDQLQSIVARIYQGQVTNLKTSLGGFAPVYFD